MKLLQFLPLSLLLMIVVSLPSAAQTTYYVKNSGEWFDVDNWNWTLDESGLGGEAATVVPGQAGEPYDAVHVHGGKTITFTPADANTSVNLSALTVNGTLVIKQGKINVHSLSGTGEIVVPSKESIDFIENAGVLNDFEGTVTFTASTTIGYTDKELIVKAAEVKASGSGVVLTMQGNITFNGDLTAEEGATIQFANGKNTATVHGNVTVGSGSKFTSAGETGEANESQLNVYGDFGNAGTVEFASGTRTDDNTAKSKRVLLTFLGAADSHFTAEGTTTIFRLINQKSVTATTTVTGNITALGKTQLMDSYENLPWVPKSGVLRLGSGLKIDCWGTNLQVQDNGNQNGNYSEVLYKSTATMYIPEDATLWISGADVTVGSETYPYQSGVSTKGNILVAGTLRVSAGKLAVSENAFGLVAISPIGETAKYNKSKILIDGGELVTTRIETDYRTEGWSQTTYSRNCDYEQTGGKVSMTQAAMSQFDKPNIYIIGSSKFVISGGELVVSKQVAQQSANGSYANGINMDTSVEIDITGGTVELTGEELGSDPAHNCRYGICMPNGSFYNLKITNGADVEMTGKNWNQAEAPFVIYNKFLLGENCTFSHDAHEITIDGDIEIKTGASMPSSTGTLYIAGSDDSNYTDEAGLTWNNVVLRKSNASFTVANGSVFKLCGSFTSQYGSFVGDMQLCGSAEQTITVGDAGLSKMNLTFANTAGNVVVNGNIEVASVHFAAAAVVNIGGYNFKAAAYPTKAAGVEWGTSCMFMTNNASGAKGLTLPIPSAVADANIFPIGSDATHYAPVNPRYNSTTGGNITVVPVFGIHPAVSATTNVMKFYWRITSDAESIASGSNSYRAYLPTTTDLNLPTVDHAYKKEVYSHVDAMWHAGSEFDSRNKYLDYSKNYLSGDYTAGVDAAFNGDDSINRWKTTASGNWTDAIFDNVGNASSGKFSGSEIKFGDIVYICPGHEVVADGAIQAGQITIYSGGKLTVSQTNVSTSKVGAFAGGGTLQYDMNSDYSIINADYNAFCTNDTATFVYNSAGQYNDCRLYNGNRIIFEYPNLVLTTSVGRSFYSQIHSSDVITVNGNLKIDAKVEFSTSNNESIDVKKDVEITSNGNLIFNNQIGTTFYVRGNLYNSGTFTGRVSLVLYNNLVNNGTIALVNEGGKDYGFASYAGLTIFQGESGQSTNMVTVTGSAGAGQTNLGAVMINKAFADARIRFDIPVGDAGGISHLNLQRGILRTNYAGATTFKYFTTNGQFLTEKLDEFDIPTGTAMEVFNGGNVTLYCTPNDVEANQVRLDGSLSLMGNSTVSVGDGTGFSGIGYTANSGSALTIGNGSTVNAAFLSPYTAASFMTFVMDSDATLNIKSGSTSGTNGVFDIRGGSVTMSETVVVNIFNLASPASTTASLYYAPSTSLLSKGSKIVVDVASSTDNPFNISAEKALPSLAIASGSAAYIYGMPLVVANDLTIDGTLASNGNNLTINGNMAVASAKGYVPQGNTTYFEGTEEQLVSGASVEFYDFVSKSQQLNINTAATVMNDMEVSAGTVAGSGSLNVGGNASISYQTTVDVEGSLTLANESASQTLFCEGTIGKLVIDNANGVVSNEQQTYAIGISKNLHLQKGVFRIGGNLLSFASGATISGSTDFSKDLMISTNASATDRGVQLTLNAGKKYNFVVPIGCSSKYTPVEISELTVSATSVFSFAPVNALHPLIRTSKQYTSSQTKDVLRYYWVVKSENVKVSSGTVRFTGLLSDADGYSNGNYGTAIYQSNKGVWKKMPKDGVTAADPLIYLDFDWKGIDNVTGDYTAGNCDAMPDKIAALISGTSGNWSGKVWYEYDVETGKTTGTELISVDNKSGYGIFIAEGHTIELSSANANDNKQSLTLVEVNGVLDLADTKNNSTGYLSGTGRVIVRSSNSMLSGDCEQFFSTSGGTIEYAGTTDYDVYIVSTYANNVVFSGTGKRNLRSDRDMSVLGTLTIEDGVEIVSHGRTLSLYGDVDYYDGTTSGSGEYAFAGTTRQNINKKGSKAEFALPGMVVSNAAGINANMNIGTETLAMQSGIVYMNGNTLTVSGTRSDAVTGGGESCYIDGALTRYLQPGMEEVFPIGDSGRYAELAVKPATTGYWTVQYHNAEPTPALAEGNSAISSLGTEYWTVYNSDCQSAQVRLRWDAASGGFNSASTVVTYNGSDWEVVSFTNKVGNDSEGSVLAEELASCIDNGGRIYAFGQTRIASGYTWLGLTGTSWTSTSNWSGGLVPNNKADVVIPAGCQSYPIITTTANANTISVAEGATLDIQGGSARLNVGNITNDGTITVEYTPTASPAFVQQSGATVTGKNKIIAKRTFEANRLYYTGSATSEGTITAGTLKYLSHFDGAAYVNVTASNQFGGDSQLTSMGTIGFTENPVIEQKGTLMTNSPVTHTLRYEDWDWLSNPYPFSINISSLKLSESASPTVWVRAYGSGVYSFITHNLETNTSVGGSLSSLAPFGAFCVQKLDAGATLTINPSIPSTGATLKSATVDEVESDVLRLVVDGTEAARADEMAFVFRDGGSLNYKSDSRKYFESGSAKFHQIYATKGRNDLAIAFYPQAAQMIDTELPIAVRKSASVSDFSITATNIADFTAASEVYLIDYVANKTIDLRKTPTYTCASTDNLTADRFAIVLKGTTTDEGTPNAIGGQSAVSTRIYASDNSVVVLMSAAPEKGSVRIYDISGHLVAQTSAVAARTEIEIGTPGIYIVEAQNGSDTSRSKVSIF